jgi:hypothetical protein
MHRSLVFIAALAFAAGASACKKADNLTDPNVIAHDLGGTWARVGTVVGSSTVLTLSVADTVISGTGTFALEAGASGTLTVSGVIAGTVVKFDIVTSIGLTEHFNGQLTSPGMLSGSLWTDSDPVATTFRRQS